MLRYKHLFLSIMFLVGIQVVKSQTVNLDLGLVGKYCLDGDGIDLSPNKNHGTLNNGSATEDRFGTPGGAISFSGSLSYLQIPNKNIFNSNYTYSFWYNVLSNPSNGTARIMLGVGGGTCDQTVNICNNYFGVYTGINAGGYYNPSSTYNATDGVTLPPTNQWNHIASVKTNDSIKLFINGRFIASAPAPNAPCYQGVDLGAKLGGRAGHNQYFNGKMDDLFIYNRALSDTEIKALYSLSNQFSFTLGPDQIMVFGDTILLTPSDTAEKYFWSTGDTTKDIKITSPGTYWVDLQRTCASNRDSITIGYGAKAILGSDTSYCQRDSLELIPRSAKGDTIIWSTGDTTPTIWVKSPGIYVLHAYGGGFHDYDEIVVSEVILDIPKLGNDTTICPGSVISLDPGPTGNQILWSTGVNWPTINLYDSGTFMVTFSNGICKASDTINIAYPASPSSFLTKDTVLCESDSIRIGDLNPVLNNYTWKDNNSGIPRYFSAPGSYILSYSKDGCVYEEEILIRTKLKPQNLTFNDTIICSNANLTLNFNNLPNQIILWSNGNSTNTTTYSSSGIEWIQVTDSGCSFIDSFEINNFINLDLGKTVDTTMCYDNPWSYKIEDLPPLYSFIWANGDTSKRRVFNNSGTYPYTISSTCTTYTKSISVTYNDCYGVFVPSGFSPNGDNLNDTFFIKILDPVKFDLKIFDRWGELIYHSRDNNEGWTGSYRGIPLPIGVYLYMGDFITLTGERISKKGTITLIR